MKAKGNIFKVSGYILMAAALMLGIASCIKDKEKEEKPDPLMKITSTSWKENETAEGCKLYADYPSDSTSALSQNIREWINETLGGTYEGDLNDGQKLIAYYGQKHADQVKREIEEIGENTAMDKSVYYVQIRNKFETERFITYTAEIYEYAGGAHGGDVEIGGVFRKSDGRRFGWDMFTSEGKTTLRNMIKEELKNNYFKANNDEEFYAMLMTEEAKYIFPLPVTAPICLRNGVKFVYQQYEIAPYAAGKPFCIIPYEKLTGLFTVTMKPLVESTTDIVATKLSLEKYLDMK